MPIHARPCHSPVPAAAASLTLALATVAGCGSRGPQPPPLPRLPSLEVAASGAAVGAAGADPARTAAVRVVRRYYAALDGLRRRMRTGPLARLLAADCPCRAQLRAIRTAIRRGEHYTDQVHVWRLVPHVDGPDLVDVVVSFDVRRGGLVDRAGHRIRPPVVRRDLHRELVVRRVAGRWLIAQVIAV